MHFNLMILYDDDHLFTLLLIRWSMAIPFTSGAMYIGRHPATHSHTMAATIECILCRFNCNSNSFAIQPSIVLFQFHDLIGVYFCCLICLFLLIHHPLCRGMYIMFVYS